MPQTRCFTLNNRHRHAATAPVSPQANKFLEHFKRSGDPVLTLTWAILGLSETGLLIPCVLLNDIIIVQKSYSSRRFLPKDARTPLATKGLIESLCLAFRPTFRSSLDPRPLYHHLKINPIQVKELLEKNSNAAYAPRRIIPQLSSIAPTQALPSGLSTHSTTPRNSQNYYSTSQ